jgi:hypothetical protein
LSAPVTNWGGGYVTGPQRIAPAERDAALGDVLSGLLCLESEFAWELEVQSGKATLERSFFEPIVSALGRGPQRVRDLLALPDLSRRDNPSEVVGMLVGTEQALPMPARGGRRAGPRTMGCKVGERTFRG